MTLRMEAFENSLGKGENAGSQHFLLFSIVFSTFPKTKLTLSVRAILLSANALSSNQSKILLVGKGIITSFEDPEKENFLTQMTNFRLYQTERVCR